MSSLSISSDLNGVTTVTVMKASLLSRNAFSIKRKTHILLDLAIESASKNNREGTLQDYIALVQVVVEFFSERELNYDKEWVEKVIVLLRDKSEWRITDQDIESLASTFPVQRKSTWRFNSS